jgi:hypothetical protein
VKILCKIYDREDGAVAANAELPFFLNLIAVELHVRDEFTSRIIDDIARRVGYLCSNPECRRATVGSNAARDGTIRIGVAAHITAASPGGPRYDATMDSEARRDQSNGIWLCQDCGKLVDSDVRHFTVEWLHNWKQEAQERAFREIVAPRGTAASSASVPVPGTPLTGNRGVEAILANMRRAALADLEGFKRELGWPKHAVALNLRMLGQTSGSSFTIAKLPDGMDVLPEITIVAPPGTGKTTTLLQLADVLLSSDKAVAVFIPLSEWSKEPNSLFATLVRRLRFQNASEQDFIALGDCGRLALLLDGWNELDEDSRDRLRIELKRLHRELPLLRVVISTRRQALDVPTSGPMVELDSLSEDQQLEIARALRGETGAALLDQAWRTPGLRGLVSTPLYLSALLLGISGESLPTTKEEVLRLFVKQHEQSAEHAEALQRGLLGCHAKILTALAVEATVSANTSMSDTNARAVVSAAEQRLLTAGQMREPPEPSAVLEILVSHHTLVRSGSSVSFHHQQFQEWYASFDVEEALRASARGEESARRRLRVDMLDQRAWEETILFACERVSRADQAGADAVAAAVELTLAIDPVLAAEMIHRSAAVVWDRVKGVVLAFARRWHIPDVADRAIRFMITTGREEFAPMIWPLVTNSDDQIQLATLRSARWFRASVLGSELARRITDAPETIRHNPKDVLADIKTGKQIATGIMQSLVVDRSCRRALPRTALFPSGARG